MKILTFLLRSIKKKTFSPQQPGTWYHEHFLLYPGRLFFASYFIFNIFSKTTTTTTEALGARYESMNIHPTFLSNILSTTTWYLMTRAFPPSLSGYVVPCSKKYFYIFSTTTTTTAMNAPGARYQVWNMNIHTCVQACVLDTDNDMCMSVVLSMH